MAMDRACSKKCWACDSSLPEPFSTRLYSTQSASHQRLKRCLAPKKPFASAEKLPLAPPREGFQHLANSLDLSLIEPRIGEERWDQRRAVDQFNAEDAPRGDGLRQFLFRPSALPGELAWLQEGIESVLSGDGGGQIHARIMAHHVRPRQPLLPSSPRTELSPRRRRRALADGAGS